MKDSKDKFPKKTTFSRGHLIALSIILVILILTIYNFRNIQDSKKLRSGKVDVANIAPSLIMQALEEAEPVDIPDEEFSLLHVDNKILENINTVYVIPGGGNADGAYPEWTKRRVSDAFSHYSIHHKYSKTAIFLALSAGSLNSANAVGSDKRIVFESQHTIRHLLELGVSKDFVFGDTFSWDTVTNAMTLRMFVEGLQVYRSNNEANYFIPNSTEPPLSSSNTVLPSSPTPQLKPLTVEVFISDFHADRVRAAFNWVLNLSPSLPSVDLHIHTVSSVGVSWKNPAEYTSRIAHEAEGVKQIYNHAKTIRTVSQFYAFLMLGGHQGLHKYLHYDYMRSEGAGW